MPIKRRRNGQFAPNFAGKNAVPTASPVVPAKPTVSDLHAGGRKGAELRTKTFLSNLLGISPDKVDVSGKQSFFSSRAPWYFNGIIVIGNERIQLRTHMFKDSSGTPTRMEISVHEPGKNGRKLTDDEISSMAKRLQN